MDYKTTTDIDIDKLNQLFVSVGWHERPRDRWERVLSITRFVISVWERNELVGFGRILEDGDNAILLDIAVHTDYQSKGIGSKIVQGLIDKIKDEKYFQIALFADIENPGSNLTAWYEKFGFERVNNGMELTKYQYRP